MGCHLKIGFCFILAFAAILIVEWNSLVNVGREAYEEHLCDFLFFGGEGG